MFLGVTPPSSRPPSFDARRYPFLLVGPTGTGKSVVVQRCLLGLGQDAFAPPNLIGFSAQTSANATQALVDAKLDKRRKVGGCCWCARQESEYGALQLRCVARPRVCRWEARAVALLQSYAVIVLVNPTRMAIRCLPWLHSPGRVRACWWATWSGVCGRPQHAAGGRGR